MSADTADDVARLQSRLERERRARRQAEVIAERGMRELWETNRQLQERVAQRTAELERLVGGLEHAHAARLRAILDLVGDLADDLADARERLEPGHADHLTDTVLQMRLLAESARAPEDTSPDQCGPMEIVDRLVELWQRPAARRGQLLTIEVGRADEGAAFHWPRVMALADTLLGGMVRHAGSGSLTATLSVGPSSVEFDVRCAGAAVDPGLALDGVVATGRLREIGAVGPDVALAERIVRSGDGALTARRGADGALEIAAIIPRAG